MGQCSMTESARNLARAVAAGPGAAAAAGGGGALRDPGVAALLAALVGGSQGGAVAGALEGAGLAPLAAVYSTVWGTVDAAGPLAEWRRELAAAGVAADAPIIITPPSA